MPLKRGFAPVAFDDLAWQDDLRRATGNARRIGEETRSRLEREGQAVDALFACDPDARDGTSLPGCVKVYLPPPGGPLGDWRAVLGEDAAALHERWLHTPGNLALTGYNPELSNGSWPDKRDRYASSNVSMTRALADSETFAVDALIARAHDLAERAVRIWPGPEGTA